MPPSNENIFLIWGALMTGSAIFFDVIQLNWIKLRMQILLSIAMLHRRLLKFIRLTKKKQSKHWKCRIVYNILNQVNKHAKLSLEQVFFLPFLFAMIMTRDSLRFFDLWKFEQGFFQRTASAITHLNIPRTGHTSHKTGSFSMQNRFIAIEAFKFAYSLLSKATNVSI